ncbi:MAG: CoA transferase [Alicyclobacillus sp.]|nr:CoA transferase [Alicyclobacillus sp.]
MTLPLEGIRVIDCSRVLAGPLCTMILADLGADVIKVEHPRGDDARRWGKSKGDVPLWWKMIARNKRLIVLDLNQEEDHETVRKLAAWADILIENFRPGRMEQWGLGYEQLKEINPRLIMVRVTGFGQYGPRSGEPGFGTLAEAFSGFAYMTGQADGPPTLPPFGLADGVAALTGTYATMIALYWRDARNGGMGQVIDLSLYEPLFHILGPQVIEYSQLGVVQQRTGNRSPRTAPRNAYQTASGQWVAVSAGTQQTANRVFEAIGRPELREDPRFSTSKGRLSNADEVDRLVAEWIGQHSLEQVLARFKECQAPIAPIYSIDQIVADDHYRARQSIVSVPDEDLGEVLMQNVIPKMSLTPGAIRHAGRTKLGADTESVYKDIVGLDRLRSERGMRES